MVRERVDIHGKVRPMELASSIPALQLKPSEIGIIKEAPTKRWATGQDLWDKRYARQADRVLEQQERCKQKAGRILTNAVKQGFVHRSYGTSSESANSPRQNTNPQGIPEARIKKKTSLGKIEVSRRWGPLDLEDENPPATAIAGRRDTVRWDRLP